MNLKQRNRVDYRKIVFIIIQNCILGCQHSALHEVHCTSFEMKATTQKMYWFKGLKATNEGQDDGAGISRIRRNLFIHKARIPARRFSSSISQPYKMFPPFASNEGYSASGLRYQSDGVRVTHPLPHSEFTRIRERTCDLTLALSHSPFAYYSYSHLFLTSTVILLLCDHRVRIFQQCFVDADRYIRILDFRCLVLLTLKWPPSIRPRSPPK